MRNILDELRDRIEDGEEPTLSVKVSAGARTSRIISLMSNNTLKLSVSQAPENGHANQAVCRILAMELGVDERRISILKGEKHSLKVIKIRR